MNARVMISGAASAGIGLGLLVPAIVARMIDGRLEPLGVAVVSLAVTLITGGLFVLVWSLRTARSGGLPPPVRAAVTAAVLFLSFFALEVSDGLTRRGGVLHPISASLFLPTLALLYGLTTGRRWAWWTSRGLAAVFSLWFLGFIALIPFADLRSEGVPVPWYGRVYMIGVSLLLGGILVYAYRTLGRAEARLHFGLPDLRPDRGSIDSHVLPQEI